MAKSAECKCDSNFTCGYCLRNAPPPHTTSYNPNPNYQGTKKTDTKDKD